MTHSTIQGDIGVYMPENRKIKIKDETDKTLYEVKLDSQTENKKMNPVLKGFLLILAIPAGVAIRYLLFKYLYNKVIPKPVRDDDYVFLFNSLLN